MEINRAQKLVLLALKSKEKKNTKSLNKNTSYLPKSSTGVYFKKLYTDGEVFHPLVSNETSSSFVNGLTFAVSLLSSCFLEKQKECDSASAAFNLSDPSSDNYFTRNNEDITETKNLNVIAITKSSSEIRLHKDGDFFRKVVLNETDSSLVNGFIFDVMQLPSVFCENFESECESVDDSIEDPNYSASDSQSSTDDDNEVESMGIVEHNLNTSLIEAGPPVESIVNGKENRNSRKRKRNSGEIYTNAAGKQICSRKFVPLFPCSRDCQNKISPEVQASIFNQYWEQGDYNFRLKFIAGLIEVQKTKTTRNVKSNSSPRNREYSYIYYLDSCGLRVQVCQKCFKATLGETDRFIRTVIRKKIESNGGVTKNDQRGKAIPTNKCSAKAIQEVFEHINSFPAYESHYTRKVTSKKYLQADLNITTMHRLYAEKTEKPVSLSKYSSLFKTLDIKFKKPKADTCTTCDTLKLKISTAEAGEVEKLKADQEQHHKKADFAYAEKKRDISNATASSKVFTFDLQQCLTKLHLQPSVVFYKRQLYTFNLTVHDCTSGKPVCYMWYESIANRGGNEIASCLDQHIKSIPAEVKNIVFYSDSCFGQNKNSIVATMFSLCVVNCDNINIIDHKFLEPGHTHMECDVDHSIIERKKKLSSYQIHHPRNRYQFIRSVGTQRTFSVHEMTQNMFFDFGNIAKTKFTFRKTNEANEKVNWRDIKWLRYIKEEFGKIYYKNSLDENEPFKIINIRKRGFISVNKEDIPKCYTEPIPISAEKKKDLISMLPLVSNIYHNFYKNLKTKNMEDYHPDITNDDVIDD